MGLVGGLISLIYAGLPLVGLLAIVYGLTVGDMAIAGDGIVVLVLFGGAIVWALRLLEQRVADAMGAHLLEPNELMSLQERVARLASQADLPRPRIALLEAGSANAFAIARARSRAAIVLTRELLDLLTPRELDAVIAHELAHLANFDGILMTLAAVPRLHASRTRPARDEWSRRILLALTLPLWLLPYLIAGALMLALSRYREFAADRGSALITGRPEQLMSALQKISQRQATGDLRLSAGVSPLCIVPTQTRRIGLLRDHPSLDHRLKHLAAYARHLGKSPPPHRLRSARA